jgi:hypothetical protein
LVAASSTLPSLHARSVTVCCSTSHVASTSRRVWGRLRSLHSHAVVRNAARCPTLCCHLAPERCVIHLFPLPAREVDLVRSVCESVPAVVGRRLWWEAGPGLWRLCGIKPAGPPACSRLLVTVVMLDRLSLPSTRVLSACCVRSRAPPFGVSSLVLSGGSACVSDGMCAHAPVSRVHAVLCVAPHLDAPCFAFALGRLDN